MCTVHKQSKSEFLKGFLFLKMLSVNSCLKTNSYLPNFTISGFTSTMSHEKKSY